MKTILFPGWASFETFYKKEVLEEFFYWNDRSFDDEVNVIAWSMGTLQALEYIKSNKVNKLILMAPTIDFTRSNSITKIDLMINGLKENKLATLKNFYKMNFYKGEEFRKFWNEYQTEINNLQEKELIEGLEYLKKEKIQTLEFSNVNKLYIFLDKYDKIIPNEDNVEFLKFDNIYYFEKGHNFLYNNEVLKELVRSILID